jgi:hypothetical protein
VQILNFRQRYLVGAAGGFELRLLDTKQVQVIIKKWSNNNDFVKELNKRRVIECV